MARGRPIRLASGKAIAGPRALRSKEKPSGLPSLTKEHPAAAGHSYGPKEPARVQGGLGGRSYCLTGAPFEFFDLGDSRGT